MFDKAQTGKLITNFQSFSVSTVLGTQTFSFECLSINLDLQAFRKFLIPHYLVIDIRNINLTQSQGTSKARSHIEQEYFIRMYSLCKASNYFAKEKLEYKSLLTGKHVFNHQLKLILYLSTLNFVSYSIDRVSYRIYIYYLHCINSDASSITKKNCNAGHSYCVRFQRSSPSNPPTYTPHTHTLFTVNPFFDYTPLSP